MPGCSSAWARTRVIQPEREIGQRLAQHLGRTNVIDYIGFSDDFSILEIKTPRSWIGKTLGQLGVRARYGINVLAIRTVRAAWRM